MGINFFSLNPKHLVARFKENLRVKPLSLTCDELSQWFKTPIGTYQLEVEGRLIGEKLNNLFGYHLMELSICEQPNFSKYSRINHCFQIAPRHQATCAEDQDCGAVAQYDALPFEDEQIDVTILHHILEFSENPHQTLKEAARVTMPRGYIIIVGFNPISIDGFFHFFGKLFTRRAIWRRHSLHARRMRDWLAFLDFSCQDTRYTSYNLSINSSRYLSHSQFVDRIIGSRFPFGSSYCLIARKDKSGLTPIKPLWEKSPLMQPFPIPKEAIKAKVAKSAMILPFRSKVKKST